MPFPKRVSAILFFFLAALLPRAIVAAAEVTVDARTAESELVEALEEELSPEEKLQILKTTASAPQVSAELVKLLQTHSPDLPDQTAIDLAAVIESAQKDPQTQELLQKFQGSGKEVFDEFVTDLKPEDIVSELVESLEALQKLDETFENPELAVQEMVQAGMMPESQAQQYLENPKLLEEDTRKMVYFSIVSLAAAGGYLQAA